MFLCEAFLVIFIHKIIIPKLILCLVEEGWSYPTAEPTDLAELLSHVGAYHVMQLLVGASRCGLGFLFLGSFLVCPLLLLVVEEMLTSVELRIFVGDIHFLSKIVHCQFIS